MWLLSKYFSLFFKWDLINEYKAQSNNNMAKSENFLCFDKTPFFFKNITQKYGKQL